MTTIDSHASVALMFIEERLRQINEEGFTPEKDDRQTDAELAFAAAHYALPSGYESWYGSLWPWVSEEANYDKKDEKPRIRQLVIAGALIMAEIERLQRAVARGE